MLADSTDAPPGTIGLRWVYDNSREDFYVAPDRDHICLKRISWRLDEDQWRVTWSFTLDDLVQLPGGQWVATKRSGFSAGDSQANQPDRTSVTHINVTVLAEDEFPPDVFDGQKLIEEAKEQGKEIVTY